MPLHRYTHAILCRIPLSLRTRGEVTLDEARTQHLALAQLLRELDIDVVEMPPDENSPLCVFVEDVAVVCNGIALIARPNEPTRLKELDTIRAVLKKELEIPLIEISDQNARLDGGDVLFTGREFFVGLSHFTNEAGARAVAAAFPEYPCVPIKVGDGGEEVIVESLTSAPLQVAESKRLKALVTMAGPDVICVGAGKESQEVLKRIEREATYNYQTLTVPEDAAANVLYVNGTLIHRSENEIPQSSKVFAEKVEFPTRSLRMSELAKVSSGLSSCCLLVRRPRHIRSI
ncbi:PREDICTED: N(G),N(G)-dimethylarginine dimethylaminohydrolase 1 isoform X1 [Dinoponera quadriceps]|uniref:N(G),N(G)-dimethylarginine dimethylaminohydrolase 1 isoform X1 n=1 Tax=Dinoponera quadriceps TaxID=609295 RepID=A0A6P3XH82_DINQU|nr:PREDICTED: N(G),N(G)-dimethylarginine dimethylaminohydrolase 1 isoform X1 [Dinoponera quadriceps]